MKAKEIRERTDAELEAELVELEQSLFKLRMQGRAGISVLYDQFKTIRRDIARIKTIQVERATEAAAAAGDAGEDAGAEAGNG